MIKFNGPANYQIKVSGILAEKFLHSFDGLKIITEKDEENNYNTLINIRIKDQAELSGIIKALHEWAYSIISVECTDLKKPRITKISKQK